MERKCYRDATPKDELWHRFHAPERGLSPEDLKAFRESKRGPIGKLLSAMLKRWLSARRHHQARRGIT